MTRGLAIVVAHPDDDTWGATGTAALHANDPGFELTVIHVTSGEAGEIADPSLATRETLGPAREAEDDASWKALGVVPARHEYFRHPDGGVPDIPREELVSRIAQVLVEARPDVVITFGPEGVTAHRDHVAVGEATTEAFRLARSRTGGAGLRRLLWVCIGEGELVRFSEELVARGMDPIDSTQPYQPRGVPDERVHVAVDCSSVWRRKRIALAEHKTQGGGADFPEDLYPELLGRETFTIAWPERSPDQPMLGDVFEGLGGS